MTDNSDQPLDRVQELMQRLERFESRLLSIEKHLHLDAQIEDASTASFLSDPFMSKAIDVGIEERAEDTQPIMETKDTSIDRMLRKTPSTSSRYFAAKETVKEFAESVSNVADEGSLLNKSVTSRLIQARDKSQSNQTLEAKIGLFWLNKIGIGSLVVGMALLLLYSFQYFGPWFKIAAGFGVALTLFGLAIWVERRQAMTWYSNSLFGGGWALAYFTCFAMCFVPAVQVINNQILDLCGLTLIAILATLHSIRRNAEIMSILCVSLALITIGLSPVLEFSFGASAILAVMISYIAVHQKWYRFLLIGAVFSLISFFLIYPQILGGGWFYVIQPPIKILFALLLPLICWLSFNISFLFLGDDKEPEAELLISTAVLNALGAISVCLLFLQPQFANIPFLPWLVLSVGYFAHAKLSSNKNLYSLLHLDVLAALSAFNIGLALQIGHMALDPNTEIICWLVQVLILTSVGLRNNIKSMRWFAVALAAISYLSGLTVASYSTGLVNTVSTHIVSMRIMLVVSVLVSGLCSMLYRRSSSVPVQGEIKTQFYGNAHLTAMALFLALVPYAFNFSVWADVWLIVLSVGFIVAGAFARYPYCRFLGNAGVVLNTLYLPALSIYWKNEHAIPRLLLLYATSLLYGKGVYGLQREQSQTYRTMYLILASIQLAALTLLNAQPTWLTLLLMLEGITFLGLGFIYRDQVLRLLGNCFAALSIMCPILFMNQWTVIRELPMIVVLYFIAFVHKHFPSDLDEEHADYYKAIYVSVATLLLTALIATRFKTAWITPSLGIEGLILLGTGFSVRDKLLRVLGLSIFGVLVFKLLFIDFAGAPTIHRIFSFIVAGVVLLLASYAYGRFARRFME